MDTESLLGSLNAHKVRYVVIGAAAFPVHAYARATLDIDIYCPQVTPRDSTATAVMVLAVQVPVVPDAKTTP